MFDLINLGTFQEPKNSGTEPQLESTKTVTILIYIDENVKTGSRIPVIFANITVRNESYVKTLVMKMDTKEVV